MNEPQVEILESELIERFLQRFGHAFPLVRNAPELAGDEKLFTLDNAWNDLLQRFADFLLIVVCACKVEASITEERRTAVRGFVIKLCIQISTHCL